MCAADADSAHASQALSTALSRDRVRDVRIAVAGNKNSPTKVHRALPTDADPPVATPVASRAPRGHHRRWWKRSLAWILRADDDGTTGIAVGDIIMLAFVLILIVAAAALANCIR